MRRKARAESAARGASNRKSRTSRPAGRSLAWLASAVAEKPEALVLLLEMVAQRRISSHTEQSKLLPPFAWKVGYALGAADHVLDQLGAPWFLEEVGDTENDNWLWQLRGGLDTYARICWCLRFGYTFAGVALARWYLERWTHNIAFSYEVARREGETDVSYIDRAWAQYPELMRSENVGRSWADLSELLHGRKVTLGQKQVRITLDMDAALRVELHELILRVAEVALRQVRGCIAVLADEQKLAMDARAYLQAPVDLFSEAPEPPDFLSVFARPLDYAYVMSTDAAKVTPWGKTYRTMIGRGTSSPLALTGFHSWMSIEERWVRFADEARGYFNIEAERLGGAFAPDSLGGLLVHYRGITQMAEFVAENLRGSGQAEALQTAALSLESAWVLWLQDVDQSLIAMRSVLESTARARVHRLKPAKAAALEARGSAVTPHRWLEAAGWGRLAPFARALGEFSHLQQRSRHDESRDLLTAIQRTPVAGLEIYTGRARALEEIARMLAHEVAGTLDGIDAPLSAAYRARVLSETAEETESRLAEWLERGLQFRSHSFGEPNYPIPVPDTALTADEAAQVGVDPALSSPGTPSVHPD